jgi:hypothetical protein
MIDAKEWEIMGIIRFHIGIHELTWESRSEERRLINTVDYNLLTTTSS